MHHHDHRCIPPDGMIGPRVMYLSKMLKKYCNEAFAEQNLFSGQQDILFSLNSCEGKTLGDLAKELGIATATASISVKRMEKSGFIKRDSDDKDARVTRLYLTEKGKKAPKNVQMKMDSLERVFTNGMSQSDVIMLTKLLDKAIDNFIKEEIEK